MWVAVGSLFPSPVEDEVANEAVLESRVSSEAVVESIDSSEESVK